MNIKCLVLDVDGVLTDGSIWLTDQGIEFKQFHIHDGLGIKRVQDAGIEVAIISGRSSPSVSARMAELKVNHVYQGCQDKLKIFLDLIYKLNIKASEVAYIGDDLPDIPVMQKVGLSIAVANAQPEVKTIAHWHTQKSGGQGAVREACERILVMQTVEHT